MGDYATHWEGVGRIPPQADPQAYREENLEREVRSVDITPAGGHDFGSRTAGGGDLRLPPPEHVCIVHCDQEHYGTVSISGADTGAKDIQVVEGTRRSGCGSNADGSLGGGTDGGGRGDRRDGRGIM